MEAYQLRVIAECVEYENNARKLGVFLTTSASDDLPAHERDLMTIQLATMTTLVAVLTQRIRLFKEK